MPTSRDHGDKDAARPSRHLRDRRPVSCLPCRARKLRCDRITPVCGTCIRRGDINACTYHAETAISSVTPPHAQMRIDRLESLVQQLLDQGSHQLARAISVTSSVSETDSRPEDNVAAPHQPLSGTGINRRPPGSLVTAPARTRRCLKHKGHWEALLSQVRDSVTSINTPSTGSEETYMHENAFSSQMDCAAQLLHGLRPLTYRLPARPTQDVLVNRFFLRVSPAVHVLHTVAFHEQYQAFCADKSSVSPAWLALLFSMLRIAAIDLVREDDEPRELQGKCQELDLIFKQSAAECLALADSPKPQEHLVEALCLQIYAEYLTTRDVRSTVWTLLGTIVRLAQQMGYHEPLEVVPRPSPFQAEMQRRIWAFIGQADILLGFQVGLPSVFGAKGLQITLPQNIDDNDGFVPSCDSLPVAHPQHTYTAVSFLIAKTRLAMHFNEVLAEIEQEVLPTAARIVTLERQVRQTYEAVPVAYKVSRPCEVDDTLSRTSARYSLAGIYHKTLCVLHSRYAELDSDDTDLPIARKICLNSAMSILHLQAVQHHHAPIEGRLRTTSGYQTSLAIHDFLLAANILCADLGMTMQSSQERRQTREVQGLPSRDDMLAALKITVNIHRDFAGCSADALKATTILEQLLADLQPARSRSGLAKSFAHVPSSMSSTYSLGHAQGTDDVAAPPQFIGTFAGMSQPRGDLDGTEDAAFMPFVSHSGLTPCHIDGRYMPDYDSYNFAGLNAFPRL